jgi:two-component system NtrC family sensor kinase
VTDPEPRVLVIDDEPEVAKALAAALTRRRCRATVCSNATDGLARLHAGERFELIVCDVVMPDMTGTEFWSSAVALEGGLKEAIVLITGGARPEQVLEIAGLGLRCLQKPLDIAALNGLADQGRARIPLGASPSS